MLEYFWQKFRESNYFPKEFTKKGDDLTKRFFSGRVNLSFFRTGREQRNILHSISRIFARIDYFKKIREEAHKLIVIFTKFCLK